MVEVKPGELCERVHQRDGERLVLRHSNLVVVEPQLSQRLEPEEVPSADLFDGVVRGVETLHRGGDGAERRARQVEQLVMGEREGAQAGQPG